MNRMKRNILLVLLALAIIAFAFAIVACNQDVDLPTVYSVTFVADGNTVDKQTYTAENKNIDEPRVPYKTGYKGAWENYELTTGDVTVNAVYTAKKYVVFMNYDGATCDNEQQTIIVTYNQLVDTLPLPTKNDNEFAGWYFEKTEVTENTLWQYDDDSITLVARWIFGGAIEYSLNDDGTYTVRDLLHITGADMIVPDTYNGKPVTAIGDGAFSDCYGLRSIIIPDREGISDLHPTNSY